MAVTAGVVLFSLALIFLPGVMQSFFNWMLFSGSRSNASFSDKAVSYLTFVYGVLGAVMIGWMVSFFFILIGPFRRGEREGWQTLTASITIWFVVDSTFSLSAGFFENAIFNILFFVLFIIPLAATYRFFHSPSR